MTIEQRLAYLEHITRYLALEDQIARLLMAHGIDFEDPEYLGLVETYPDMEPPEFYGLVKRWLVERERSNGDHKIN